ncbi:gluconolactonase, partial [Aureobasidium melanogenum]
MNFYPVPPVIKAQVLTRISEELRCKGESDWRGGFTGTFQNIFLEGPTCDEDGHLYVTDIPYGRILKINKHTKQTTVCVQYDGEPNGMVRRKDGKFIVADYKKGLLLFDPQSNQVSPLLTRNNLESFKGVNDVIVDSKGNVFFTDQGQTGMTDQSGKVYRLGVDGRLDKLVSNGISPNGLALSLDERFLYVAMTRSNEVWRLPLHPDGSTSKAGVFFRSFGNAGPDGIKLDEEGNLLICHPSLGSVFVVDKHGVPKARIVSGSAGINLTNCTFGGAEGKTLYITDSLEGNVQTCNKSVPKCSACVASQTECVFEDQTSAQVYSREEIADLEQRERDLRAVLEEQNAPTYHSSSSPATGRHRGKRYVGDEVGLNLFQFMFSSSAWKSSRQRLLQCLAYKPKIAEPLATQHRLPSLDMATQLLKVYLSGSHVMHPFLLYTQIMQSFDTIYQTPEPQPSSPQDMFTILMIFAIAAVTMHRQGKIREHPYGYYLSAMRYLGQIPHTKGKEGVQNLLLVARFGIYHHVGTSLWELARQCIRACIEMEYHLPLIMPGRTSDEEKQHNQRIFWECYQLDRYSSITLGRPFAIADHDIKVDLPSRTGLDNATSTALGPTFLTSSDLSVFIYSVQLRQITSRIRSKLLAISSSSHEHHRSFMATGEIYASLHKFLAELDHWRATAPHYEHPTCLYESQEWYDFLLEKDKLFLMRGGVNILFKSRRGVSQDIMRLWGRCATRVVELYASLYRAGRITYTRSYFQMLFHAGLSVIFCVSSEAKSRTGAGRLIPNFDATLSVCGDVLDAISEKMPDARGYAVVFESMRRSVFDNFSASPATTGHPATPREANTTSLAYQDTSSGYQEQNHVMPDNNQNQGLYMASGAVQAPTYPQWMPEMDWTNMDVSAMQGVEAGLSEYVWGDLNINADMWNRIEHMIDETIEDA